MATCNKGKGGCAKCGAKVDEGTAKYVTDHEGQKYYFCSGDCLREFNSGADRKIKY
jgi:YHS domain-containing protein